MSVLGTPAMAVDVNFSANLSGACTIAVPVSGTLGLAANGNVLGSETGGTPASVTLISIGSNVVTVGAPAWTATPAAHNSNGEVLEVAYAGLSGLSLVNADYAAIGRSFGITALPLSTLVVNARATNPNGFASGNYNMRVVVTCGAN